MSGQPLARTYYSASRSPAPVRAALGGSASCDVCVVGGGIAGTLAALHLAQRGLDVILLEAQQIGWGASGRCIRPDCPWGERKVGRESSDAAVWKLLPDRERESFRIIGGRSRGGKCPLPESRGLCSPHPA